MPVSLHSLSHAVPDFVTQAIPDDERLWVPQAENVWFRPLLLDATGGSWVNLLRVRRTGVLSRHRHPAPVHGYVIKGSWRYLEHDWIARQGDLRFFQLRIIIQGMKLQSQNFCFFYFTDTQSGRWSFAVR